MMELVPSLIRMTAAATPISRVVLQVAERKGGEEEKVVPLRLNIKCWNFGARDHVVRPQ